MILPVREWRRSATEHEKHLIALSGVAHRTPPVQFSPSRESERPGVSTSTERALPNGLIYYVLRRIAPLGTPRSDCELVPTMNAWTYWHS